MHYCIGDIHGYFDEFMSLLHQIESRDPEAQMILTGDLIDRGPKVMKTVRWAMEHITADGKYRSVLGNHEDMILKWYHTAYHAWEQAGSRILEFPPARYDFADQLLDRAMTRPCDVEPIMNFFQSLPLYIRLTVDTMAGRKQEYVIAHGWFSEEYLDPELDPAVARRNLIWERTAVGYGNPSESFIVIHGHTPTVERECEEKYYLSVDAEPINAGLIAYRKNAINLDGGRPYRDYENRFCTISAICLETMEEFFAEPVPADYVYYENCYQKDLIHRIRRASSVKQSDGI